LTCRRIAVEEAFGTTELFEEWRRLSTGRGPDEMGFWRASFVDWILNNERGAMDRLKDIGSGRLEHMDQHGIDMQILSVVSPGVQASEPAQAMRLASGINERLAAAVEKHPTRFAGLATIAPQRPQEAARELERAVRQLGMKGVIINSHTNGEYLDAEKFAPILEAASALGVPMYLHPREPTAEALKPYLDYWMENGTLGFATETSLHALRMIFGGVFDRFPRLQVILGHMGEGLPYWLHRIDISQTWYSTFSTSYPARHLKKLPSEYFKENFVVTTSGMTWNPVLGFVHTVLGAERILFAVDYPFESTSEAVTFMDRAPVSESDRQLMYCLNAERIFSL
jgi:2,3-dihydroxybenzoate decarboxylase